MFFKSDRKVSIILEGSRDLIAFQNASRLLGKKAASIRVFYLDEIGGLSKQNGKKNIEYIPSTKHAIIPPLFECDDLVMISTRVQQQHLQSSSLYYFMDHIQAAVLVVPSEERCEKPKEILLAFDGKCPQKAELKKIRLLKKILDLRVEIAHVSLMGETSESFYELDTRLALDQLDKSFRNEHYIFLKSEKLVEGFRKLLNQHRRAILSLPFQQNRTILDWFRPDLHKRLAEDTEKQFNLLLKL